MRSLAAFLDTKAASLYRHIKDKDDLYNLIAEKVISELKPSCGISNARKYLVEAAGLYRQTLLALRDSVEVFTQSSSAAYESILGTGLEILSFDDQFSCGLEVLFARFKVLK